MKLTVVGGGNWQLSSNRHPPAFLVEHDGTRILLDCGYGTLGRLAELGVDITSLNAICVTHFHSDHSADVFPITKARQIIDARQPGASAPLYLVGPHGLREKLEVLATGYCHHSPATPKHLREVKWSLIGWQEQTFSFGPLSVTPFPVVHIPGEMCLGYVVCVKEGASPAKTLIYSGDLSGPLNEQVWLREKCQKGCDLLIIEGGSSPPKHPLVSDTLAFVTDCGGKQTLINHVPLECVAIAQQLVKAYPNVSIAQDDMIIEL